jgi:hypothetical protein
MKNLLSILIVAGMVTFISCGSSKKEQEAKEKTKQDSINAAKKVKKEADSLATAKNEKKKQDTSFYFIKRILNASPVEVGKIIGKTDNGINKSDDCENLPYCEEAFYQNEKYDVLYYNNMLKFISIKGINNLEYNENCIRYLNFPIEPASVINNVNIRWNNTYEGINAIIFYPSTHIISVEVNGNYNKRF